MKAVDIAFRWCAPEPIDRLFFQDTLAVRAGKRVERLGTYKLPVLPRSQDCSKPSPSSMAVIISSVVVRGLVQMWDVGGKQIYFYPTFRKQRSI